MDALEPGVQVGGKLKMKERFDSAVVLCVCVDVTVREAGKICVAVVSCLSTHTKVLARRPVVLTW